MSEKWCDRLSKAGFEPTSRAVHGGEHAYLMAASTMVMLPVLLVFFFCQRYFIQGITLTGLKG